MLYLTQLVLRSNGFKCLQFEPNIFIVYIFDCNVAFFLSLKQKGYAYDPDCMYINGSGRDYYEFYIQLNRCGTLGKNAISEKSRENPTVFIFICLRL